MGTYDASQASIGSFLTSTVPQGPRTTHSSSSNHSTTISVSISQSRNLINMIYGKAIQNLHTYQCWTYRL